MSYWLEDARGEWLGDFATNIGIITLRGIGPNLDKFLSEGETDEPLAKEVIKDVIGHRKAGYVAEMLQQKGIQFPVIITNGTGPVENEEDEEEITEHHGRHNQKDHGNWAQGQKKFKFAMEGEKPKKGPGPLMRAAGKIKPGEIEERLSLINPGTQSFFTPVPGRERFRANLYKGERHDRAIVYELEHIEIPYTLPENDYNELVKEVNAVGQLASDLEVTAGEFQFADDYGGFKVTGRGNAKAIMTGVAAEFVNHIKYNDDVAIVKYTAEEPSRQKLYDFLTKRASVYLSGYEGFRLDEKTFAVVNSNWRGGEGKRLVKAMRKFESTREKKLQNMPREFGPGLHWLSKNPIED